MRAMRAGIGNNAACTLPTALRRLADVRLTNRESIRRSPRRGCPPSHPRTGTKVSSILWSDRSEGASLMSCTLRRSQWHDRAAVKVKVSVEVPDSDCPDHRTFAYTFDHYAEIISQFTQALGLEHYTLYM